MISFVIPGHPVPKARARVTRNGAFTPTRTRRFEALVSAICRSAIGNAQPMTDPVLLDVKFYLKIPLSWSKNRKLMAMTGQIYPTSVPDLDNLVKAISDGMNKIAYNDDSQIVTCSVMKRYSDMPRTEVRVDIECN